MPTLTVGDLSFECRPNLPKWRLMELAAAMRANDPMAMQAGMHDFVLAVLVPEERDRFVETMRELDDAGDIDAFDSAVGALIQQYAAPAEGAASPRPTERSSALPPGPRPTGGTSRVDSSSEGTHRVMKLSRPAGRSVAS